MYFIVSRGVKLMIYLFIIWDIVLYKMDCDFFFEVCFLFLENVM